MKLLSKNIIGLFLFSISATSSALTLSEAMDRAQLYDTTFQAAYANYMASIEASSQSTSAILPQIALNASIQRGRIENDSGGNFSKSDNNNEGYSLDLDQVIYDKSVFDNLDQGDAIAAKALADFEAAKQDTIVRVATAYFNVLTSIDTLETASAERKAIGKQLEQSTERFNVGLSAITDVKEQQASYDIALADEIIATNDVSNSREALRVIINIYPEKLQIAREDIPLVVPDPMDIDAWQEKSLQTNFTLLSAKYSVDAAQSSYDGSKGGHYPTLRLNASYGQRKSEPLNFNGIGDLPENTSTDARVLLHLNVPIYSGGFTSSTVRQKSSQLNQAKALHEQERRRTIALARSAYLSIEAGIATVKARRQAVISTQTSLDATLAGFDAGTRTSVDVLISQRLLFSSKRDYSFERYNYLTDSLELKRVAGTLTINDIDEINGWLIPRPTDQQ